MTNAINDKPLVLVTGSTGLIGSRVIRELAGDYMLVGLDVQQPSESAAEFEWRECDLTSDASVERVLTEIQREFGGHVASVVHLAAYYDFSGQPSPMYDKLTVQGTRRLIKNLRRFDRVEQFIFSSSLLVMEPVDKGEQLTERSPTRGEWDYPESKLQAERVLKNEHGDIPVVTLRLAGAYDEDCHSLPISQQIRRIYEKQSESFVFPGDADHGQPFVHLDDVVACIRTTIEKRSALDPFETFLIAEPEVLSYRQLQDEIGKLVHGKEWPTIEIPKSVAKIGARVKGKLSSEDDFIKPWMIDLADDHYPVEIRRARELLNWSPRHLLSGTLPEMIQRLKRGPRQWYETNNLPVPEELTTS